MKRFLSVVLAIALLLTCAPAIPLTANAATSGYYTYTVSNGKATIIDCNTSISGDITIPATLGGYPVTSIGSYAFEDCSSLTSVEIPDSVTSIGSYAFYNCRSLTSVEIGDSVTSIGSGAFHKCSSLTSVVISDSVTSIGNYAFEDCISLTSVEIPDSVTSIGTHAFLNCSSLTSVVISDSVTSIGNWAFSGCSSLTGIWVDANNTAYCSDEQGVLYNNDKTTLIRAPGGITECIIPNSVTSISDDAFRYCSSLTSVEIPDSVTSISDYVFEDCSSLTSVEIPDSVTSIGWAAFYNCISLTSVVIGNSVTSIGDWAFSDCISLTSVVIGNSVTSIGDWAFSYCSSLSHVAYTGTQSQWSSISIGSDNTDLTNATRHYETSFEIIDNCVEAGVYCPVCEEFIVRTEKGNHQETPVPGYAPTCTESGLTDGTVCTMCGEVVTQQVEIPATGHDTIDGVCRNCDYGKNVVVLEGDGETFYSTVENALAAATGGTVKLLTDMQAGTLVLPSGVNLDLNGYTLTANIFIAMDGAKVTDGGEDCVGGGCLKIAKGNLALAEDNGGVIPVWNGTDGYIFTKVTFQQMANPLGNGAAQYLFLPSFSNAEAAALLADGGADNGLKLKVSLIWNDGQSQQLYTYKDSFVEDVFASNGKLAFSLIVTGISDISDMTVSAVIVTDSGAQATNISTPIVAG